MTISKRLAMAQLANSVGDGAFIVTSALFFTRVVGLSVRCSWGPVVRLVPPYDGRHGQGPPARRISRRW